MRLIFKQRIFSWFDSYDIYNEEGETVYTVEGKLSWGHCLHIMDGSGIHIATLKERIFSLLPKFELYIGSDYVGSIRKEFSLFFPKFTVDCCGWEVDGDLFQWDYKIVDGLGTEVATISKELFRLSDTYVIDVSNPKNALHALLVVLAIDAEKCSDND